LTSPLKDITLGTYAYRDSVVHKLDPRTKLLCCFLFLLAAVFIKNIYSLLGYLFFIVLLFLIAKLNLKIFLGNIKTFSWLFILTIGFHVFFTKGRILFCIPVINVNIYSEGLNKGLFYSLRLIALILTANILTLTTSPMEITDGIERLIRPFKIFGFHSHEIAMMFSISLRFIPILIEESDRIRKAQISRGSNFQNGFTKKIRQLMPLIIPLFLSAFRRANDLAYAMDARCYTGTGRTNYIVLKLGTKDIAAFFFAVIFLGVAIYVSNFL